MNAKKYLNTLDSTDFSIENDTEIEHISYNSKDIKENTLFICKGLNFKEEYLKQAVENGAICYISTKKYDVNADFILVSDIREAMVRAVRAFYGKLEKNFNLIGITGTKGKSTTVTFVNNILNKYLASQNKPKSAILSSIITYDGVTENEAHLTTPEPIELYNHFQNAKNSSIEYLAMEVSSQAVKYKRIYDVAFDVGCYLNIGEDHISPKEHPDFDDYFKAKLDFFKYAKTMCVNLDGEHTKEVLDAAKSCEKIITYSKSDENATIYAKNIKEGGVNSIFTAVTPTYEHEFITSIPGFFNIENALAAISICYALDIPPEFIYVGLLDAKIPGRMEIYSSDNKKMTVIVDYAHNKMSFNALFNFVKKEYLGKKIYAIFGSAGGKAFDRREILGSISNKFADMTYITEEDPGEEPVMNVCLDIAKHIDEGKYEIIIERKDAIRKAILENEHDDVIVLLLGKGAEIDQKRGTEYVLYPSDTELAIKFIDEYNQKI